jgi:ligand-binding sensor domain-containing protein/two-component sensor histidine kinase
MSCNRACSDYSTRQTRQFRSLAYLALCIFLLFSGSKAERLPVKTYTVADGLLRDLVYRIKQDSHGFLWFCTAEGISRFDGASMTNFTTVDGLPNRFIEDFLETRDGTIYIATGKGLARLNPQGTRGSHENPLFTIYTPDNPKAEKIQTLIEDKNRQVWVGTSDGLYKLIETGESAAFEPVRLGEPLPGFGGAVFLPSPDTLSVTEMLETEDGMLWVGTFGSGLFRLSPDGGVRRFQAGDNGFGDNKITALLKDRDGRIWVGMRSDVTGGVCVLDAADAERPVRNCYRTTDGLPANWIRDIFAGDDGAVWLATSRGLCRWQGDRNESVCKTYTAKNDLCDDVFVLAEDKDGNLWTGSSCGAKKIARYGFTTYTPADGLDDNPVNAIFENRAGELFVTNFPKTERVVSRFDGEKFSLVKPRLPDLDYHGYGWQQTVWQDSRGAWWIPTGWGLFRSPDNTSFENLADAPLEKQETGARGNEPFRIFEDSRGDIWLALTVQVNELKRWERAKNIWHDYTSQTGISLSRIVTAFSEDSHGNVWIGASSDHNDGALIRYRNGEFRIFTKAEGAPSAWTSDLFLDSRGRLWIATNENGLLRLDETDSDRFEVKKYTPADGLTSITTNCVTEDEFGRIYVGTWRGIDRLSPDTGQVENLTTADGLPSGNVESSYRDRQNNLWFLTEKGLARFQPEPVRTRKPPTILITGLRVEGEPQPVSILGETEPAALDLGSDKRQITVDFIGLGASLGEKLKYEYRLSGADWTPTAERTLNFANLGSGDYKFEVRAQTADRIYSPPANLSFRIAAPVWQRWWFLLLAALVSGGTIYVIYNYRLRRLLELERVRTRIATDLHDDIGANLTRISLLSEVARQKAENGNGSLLASIADIARESVASMNDIVWAIAPEHDSLLDLTRRMRQHSEEVFALREIDLNFNAPPSESDLKLSVGVRRDLLLIFKEAVNNAAKHSDCTKAWIDFTCRNSILKLQIKDNGRGFEKDSETDGQGLRSMTRRAESLGGTLVIDSRRDSGTSVKFEMTLQKASQI